MWSRTLPVAIIILTIGSRLHAAPVYTWSHGYGDEDIQTLSAVATDPQGNVLVCGSFNGSITIKTTMTVLFGSDLFVAKLDASGNPLWNRRVASGTDDRAWDVTGDKDGNVIAVGSGGGDIIIVKYDPNGTQQWIKTVGDASSGGDARCVATNLANETFVAGSFWGSVDLGGGPLSEPGLGGDGYAMFLVKYDPNGNHIWSRSFAWSYSTSALSGLEVDALGQVALYGDFVNGAPWEQPLDFGLGPLTSAGFNDQFLVKFSRGGRALWNHSFGGAGIDPSACLAMNASGMPAIAANLYEPVDFGGGLLVPTGSPQPCVAAFTPEGDHLWSRTFAATTYASAYGIAFAEDDLLLSCQGQGSIDFGGGPVTAIGTAYNTFVARLGDNGVHRWSFRFAGDSNVYGYVAENRGSIFVAGNMDGAADPGGGPLPYAGESDVYVARFGETLTGVQTAPTLATLEQNVPNPFNPTTSITYTLAAPARTAIAIYDASGSVVARIDDGWRGPRAHSVVWNGRNARGQSVASGVYFYRLEGVAGVAPRRMVLLK